MCGVLALLGHLQRTHKLPPSRLPALPPADTSTPTCNIYIYIYIHIYIYIYIYIYLYLYLC